MGFLEKLKSKIREVDDAADLRFPEERVTGFNRVLGVVVQKSHRRQQERDQSAVGEMRGLSN